MEKPLRRKCSWIYPAIPTHTSFRPNVPHRLNWLFGKPHCTSWAPTSLSSWSSCKSISVHLIYSPCGCWPWDDPSSQYCTGWRIVPWGIFTVFEHSCSQDPVWTTFWLNNCCLWSFQFSTVCKRDPFTRRTSFPSLLDTWFCTCATNFWF